MKKLNNENGRSMIEMLGVLAIIGVLSVGGIAGYSKAMMKYRINKTIEQITLIAGNIRTFFASQRSYSGLHGTGVILSDFYSDKTVISIIRKAKLVPDEMLEVVSDEKMYVNNAFGYTCYISGTETNFMIMITVPQEACIELASYDWNNANAVELAYYDSSETLVSHSFPIEIDEAISICKETSGNYDHGTIGIKLK